EVAPVAPGVVEHFAYFHRRPGGFGRRKVRCRYSGKPARETGCMKRVAIIGGGIAGVSAAHYLEAARRSGAGIEWGPVEKSDRLGGVIKTEQHDGYILEAGPDSFLTAKPDGAQLCRELGISDQLIGSNDAGRKTYIVVKGKLVPIPEGLEFMVPTRVAPMMGTRLFSLSTK